jgi:hypothetical protein
VLLEEAENERMHLLTFLELRQPGALFRLMVLLAQGISFNLYFLGELQLQHVQQLQLARLAARHDSTTRLLPSAPSSDLD